MFHSFSEHKILTVYAVYNSLYLVFCTSGQWTAQLDVVRAARASCRCVAWTCPGRGPALTSRGRQPAQFGGRDARGRLPAAAKSQPSPADRNPVDPVTWSGTRVPAAAVVLETSAASRRSETHRIRQSVPGARLPLRRGGGAETLPSIFTRKHRHVGAQSPGMVKAVCRRPVTVSSIRMWASVVDRIWPPVGVFNRLSWDKQPPVWNENELWHQRKAQMFECKTLFSVDLKQIHERTTEATS